MPTTGSPAKPLGVITFYTDKGFPDDYNVMEQFDMAAIQAHLARPGKPASITTIIDFLLMQGLIRPIQIH